MKIFGLISIFIVIGLYETQNIIKMKQKAKNLIVFSIILTSAFIISLLQVLDKSPISPSKMIEIIVKKAI